MEPETNKNSPMFSLKGPFCEKNRQNQGHPIQKQQIEAFINPTKR